MNINDFEDYVEDEIVYRGQDYYESIDEEDIEQVDDKEFSATVWGTDTYHIYIKLDKDNDVQEHTCSCPYDWGNVCKHEVAVLLYIRENKLYLKKGVAVGQLKLVLNEVSEQELRDFIYEKLKKDKELREDFMLEFG